MKVPLFFCIFIILTIFGCSKEKISPDVVEMEVDFSWTTGSNDVFPELNVSNVPADTKQFYVVMKDLDNGHNRAEYMLPNDEKNVLKSDTQVDALIIPAGAVKGFRGYGEGWGQIRHEVTVRAIDGNGVIVGIGKKMRKYPEEDPYK